jgi:hypothetical protein
MPTSNQHPKPQFDVTVSGAIVRDTTLPYTGGFSPDSRSVLLDYTLVPVEATTVPGAEIFDISDGTLNHPIASFPNQDGTFGGLEAVASRDFTKIVLLDENLTTGAPPTYSTQLRVRVVSFNGSTVTPGPSIVLADRIASAINDGGAYPAYFTDDNRFVIVGYIDDSLRFKLILLNTSDLSVASGPFTVATPSSGQGIVFNLYYPFHLCSSSGLLTNYFIISYSTGVIAPGTSTVESPTPPYNLIIYRVDASGFTQITSTVLPQFVNTAEAFNPFNCCLHKTKILVTSRPTYLPGQPSLFSDTTGTQSGNGETGNVRIYSFNGSDLKLLVSTNVDTTVLGTNWYIDGKTFGLYTTTGPQFGFTEGVDAMTFYQLQQNADCSFGIQSIDKFVSTPPAATTPLFSPNGKFLAIVGTQIPFVNTPTESAINNVVLYSVNSDLPPFKCPSKYKKKCQKYRQYKC